MKLAIFIVCLGIANAENSFQLFQRILKKPSSSSFADNQEEQRRCYANCGRNASEVYFAVISQKMGDFDILKVKTWKNLLNQEIVDNLCTIFNDTKPCILTCGETYPLDTDMKAVLSGYDYFCSDTSLEILYKAIPCYRKVYNEMEQVCNSNEKCGGKKDNYENIQTDNMQESVDIFCKYATCIKQCQHLKMVEECGKEQAVALYTLKRKALKLISAVNEIASCYSLSVEEDD